MGKTLEKLFDWLSVKKYSDQIPYNYIEEELQKNKRIPWVVKRKVLLNGNGRKSKSELKYIELKVPEIYDEPFFKNRVNAKTEERNKFLKEVVPESDTTDLMDVYFEKDVFEPGEDDLESLNSLEEEIPDNVAPSEVLKDFHSYEDEILEEKKGPVFYDDLIEPENPEPELKVDNSDIKKNRIFHIVDEKPVAAVEEIKCNTDIDVHETRELLIKPRTEEIQEYVSVPQVNKVEIPEVEDLSDDKVFTELKINQDYIVPTGFLHDSVAVDTESMASEIKRNSQLLVRTLADFGIESRVIAVNRGPVITLYEMQIAAGIKITKVVGLSDDIAMALAAYRVRIVAPIPGKSAIGVELPNKLREMVTLGDLIKSEEYQVKKGSLKVGLGKDILGKPVTLDLKKQPHLLIAGSTGSGKSVCVNSIITSIVYNYDPNYVRFIMVDPKMVELQFYNGVPHLLTPVITEPQIAPSILKWAIFEMERRYRLLAARNTRDIETYNNKVIAARKGEEKLPFIIIIIDELADLMMVASKEIEGYITRLAQKARAIGIHLVLATQRPSVDVITGIIKANFPARIAFQVAQKTDSRTILDQNGAEKLLGKGDMLYQSPLTSYPVRIQGAFISDDETESIVEHLRSLGTPHYIDIEESLRENETSAEISEEEDDLFVEALKIIEETRKASASYLQRRLSIGYNRAARIVERMEDLGYVGPQQGSKPRDVFI